MKRYLVAAVLFGIPLLMSLFGLIFGSFDSLWSGLNIPLENYTILTVGLSIALILIGHILSTISLSEGHSVEIENKIKIFESTLNSSLSGVSGLRVCQTSDSALAYITARLPHAKKVWNTRVPAPGVGDYAGATAVAYLRALRKAVDSGVHFRDVVGLVFKDRATEIIDARSAKGADNYCYVLLPEPNVPFFNFIVIEDVSGFREVIFGWIITPVRGFEQECFVSNNARLIDMFVALHDYMVSSNPKK
jgi:hypothetical protein